MCFYGNYHAGAPLTTLITILILMLLLTIMLPLVTSYPFENVDIAVGSNVPPGMKE